jgi:hypothetical protein
MNEQQEDFDPEDYGPFYPLYELATLWAGGHERILESLTKIIGGYEGLHELVGHDRAGEFFYRLAELLHVRAPPGKQLDYERDAELRRIDRETPKGKKHAALQAMAKQRGVSFSTLDRRLKQLRADDRQRQNEESEAQKKRERAVAAFLGRNPT